MFGGKGKPIEETTTKDIWFSLFFGTLIGGWILASSFFSQQPEGFLWIIRCFSAVWLVGWWYKIFKWRRALAEYQNQSQRPPEVEPTKMNPLAKLPPIRK